MVTKEDIKREVDKIPENLLEKAYALLKRIISQRKTSKENNFGNGWKNWEDNLEKFTPDFLDNREQPFHQIRESLD